MANPRSSDGAFRAGAAVIGALLLLLAAGAFAAPFVAGLATELVLGVLFLAAGVLRVAFAAKSAGSSRVGISALLGVLGIVAGVLLLMRPLLGVFSLAWLLGGYLVVHGLLETYAALQWRKRQRPWGLMLFGGAVAIALGALILLEWPLSGLFTLGIFAAVHLALVGVSLLIVALVGAPDESDGIPTQAPTPAPA